MLKKRLVTAFILMPLLVYIVLRWNTPAVAVVFSGFALLGAREWGRLCGWRSDPGWYPMSIGLSLIIVFWTLPYSTWWLLWIAMLWWSIVAGWLLFYELNHPIMPRTAWARAFIGGLALIPAWGALVALHAHSHFGPLWTLFLFILVWSTDTGAYFAGRNWGRRKLAPNISPGKTWVGLYGGVLAALVMTAGFVWWHHLPWRGLPWLLLIAGITALSSILGDLLESMMKRHEHLKDSGNLLPGHGGVLDRIDSLTSSAPVFVFCLFNLDPSLWSR